MADEDRLPQTIRKVLASEPVWLSVVSPWELVSKEQKGNMRSTGFIRLDVDLNHVIDYRTLPRHHADPSDCMLIAQARVEGLTLITADPRFKAYDVAVHLAQP